MPRILERLPGLIASPFWFIKDRPVLYRGRSFTLVTYGLFAALNALAVVTLTSLYLYSRGQEITPGFLLVLPVLGLGTWAGSKLMHLLALGRKFFTNPRKYLFETGFYVQGGILGAMATSALVAPSLGLNTPLLWDGLGWSALLGLFFGRLGCFNYGCCYGKPMAHGHSGVCYHNPEVKILRLKPEMAGRPVHPTQLYTALLHLLVFTAVTAIMRFVPLPNGALAGGFLIYHGLSRLLIERYRSDIHFQEGRNWTTFRSAGALSLLGVALMTVGPRLIQGLGDITPTTHPLSPATLGSLLATHPGLLVSFAVVALLVLAGFGLHGRELGSFPWSPQSRAARAEEPAPLRSPAAP